jgi:hypothetical protein
MWRSISSDQGHQHQREGRETSRLNFARLHCVELLPNTMQLYALLPVYAYMLAMTQAFGGLAASMLVTHHRPHFSRASAFKQLHAHKDVQQRSSFITGSSSRSTNFALHAKKTKKKVKDDADVEAEKNALQRTGDVVTTAWKSVLLVVTISSVVLAVDSVIKLRSQPITLTTLGPALGNLLPLAAFGFAGALRLAGLVVRVVRVLVTVPVVLGGAYLAAPSVPDLLKHSPDWATGGLVALLATPEVFEAVAVVVVVGGAAVWVLQKLGGAVSSALSSTGTLAGDDDDSDDGE